MATNTPFYSAYYDADTGSNDALVEAALADVMSGNINSLNVETTSAAAAALKKTQGNTGMFAQEFLNNSNKVDSTMPNRRNLQEGGPTLPMMDGASNLPPEAVADDVVNGAPVGMVDVPNGGGPVDDGVPTELPEGTFVLNAATIQYHGTETIDKLINDAVRDLLKEGVQISAEDPNPDDDVPVAISNGEYVIPPEVAEKIGYKKLEDMNERGLEYRKKQEEAQKKQAEAEAQQQPPPQPPQQPQETFMGLQMPPEQAGPPQAPVQSEPQAEAMVMQGVGMLSGGRVPLNEGTAQGGLSRARDAFMNWFNDTYLGGNPDPIDITPTEPPVDPKEPYYPPEVREPNSGYTEMAPRVVNPAQEGMLQQGGFVENYTYAQPQQTTLGTPFPNAVTSNPQQYGSFVQPNEQRVNAADGTEIYAGAEEEVGFDVPSLMTAPSAVRFKMINSITQKLNVLKGGGPEVEALNKELEGLRKNIVPLRLYEEYEQFLVPYTPGTELLPSGQPVTPEMRQEIEQFKNKKREAPPPVEERSAADGGFIN